jgi:hypothetical protein
MTTLTLEQQQQADEVVANEVAAMLTMPLPPIKERLFKVGWSYAVWLTKNSLAPSDSRHAEWLTKSRDCSKEHAASMYDLVMSGAKVKCGVRAVLNRKDGRIDTALTMRTIKSGCQDMELILDLVQRTQKSAGKRLGDVMDFARNAGLDV